MCHNCNQPLLSDEQSSAIRFRDSCGHCGADAHVCLNCAHYDQGSHHECKEPSAEWIRDKEKRNTCEYFRPRRADNADGPGAKRSTLDALEALFKK